VQWVTPIQTAFPTFLFGPIFGALNFPNDFQQVVTLQSLLRIGPAPGQQAWLASLPPRTQAIAKVLSDAGITGGADARAGIVALLAGSPGDAEAYAATLLEISENGISPYYDANDSLTSTMAEALATQVAAWQAQGNSPLALQAIAGVESALKSAGIGPGAAFSIAFSAKLSALGGTLPSQLLVADAIIDIVVPQKDETALVSPN